MPHQKGTKGGGGQGRMAGKLSLGHCGHQGQSAGQGFPGFPSRSGQTGEEWWRSWEFAGSSGAPESTGQSCPGRPLQCYAQDCVLPAVTVRSIFRGQLPGRLQEPRLPEEKQAVVFEVPVTGSSVPTCPLSASALEHFSLSPLPP